MTKDLIVLFERDLKKLSQEIAAYPNDESLWQATGDIKNSAGNLCLHLNGNLNHFIGTQIGKTAYVRNREAEFSTRSGTRQELTGATMQTREVVTEVLKNISEQKLTETYPEEVLGYSMTHSYFLIHLYGHLNYHLGQINYHRRMI